MLIYKVNKFDERPSFTSVDFQHTPWFVRRKVSRTFRPRDQDRYKFRVSSLRKVSQTAPYFHDGGVATLEDVVIKMAYYQLGFSLEDDRFLDIVANLKALDKISDQAAAFNGVKQ